MLPFLNGPMLSAGGNDGSFMGILRDLGLTSGLKLCLDAGAFASYPGTGQKWLDLSGGGYDFFLGTDVSVAADDPAFNGVAGKQSSAEYFSSNGGDFFRYDAAQESWMQNLAKDNAKYTILFWLYPPSIGVNQGGGFSTFDASGFNGIHLNFEGNKSRLTCLDGLAHRLPSTLAPDAAHVINAWHLLGVSLDETAGAGGGFYYKDGNYDVVGGLSTWNATYSGNEPSANTATPQIWTGRGGGSTSLLMPSGARIAGLMVWEGVALGKTQIDTIWDHQRGRFGL